MDRYRFKPLKNVNGNSVKVISSVTFEVVYKGIDVEIVALVSAAIEEEIILSWRTLQKLGIITDRFPCPPMSEDGVKSIEMAEKQWKSRKTVKFSDGGPQFRSGFEHWCKNRMSKHE